MNTELTNTSKLREFVEELRRLNVEIVHPSINKCFAEFIAKDKKFIMVLVQLRMLDLLRFQIL